MAEQTSNVEYVADNRTYLDTYDYYRRGLLEQQSVWIKQYLIPVLLQYVKKQSHLRILSVGSGEGDIDILILNALLSELNSNESQSIFIEYAVAERNPEFISRFKQRLQSKNSEFSNVKFTFYLDTLENLENEFSESTFDFIHFIHVLYYMDADKVLHRCMGKYLKPEGILMAVVQQKGNLYAKNWEHFSVKFREHVGHFNLLCETDLKAIAEKNNWKYRIEVGRRIVDVSDIIANNVPSPAGWKLLDFFFHSNNLQSSLNPENVKEVTDFFKANAIVSENGSYIARGDETVAFIFN